MPERNPIITLTTDFGESDYFVPAIKGVICGINPDAIIVDITHYVPPHDIYAAAFTLYCCYRDFPRFSTHMVVVDPGVGSDRRPILVMTDGYNFVGPDNGVFSYIYKHETVNRIVHLTTEHYFRTPVSATFHGRDVFAPCAAAVSKLIEWTKLGVEITDPARFNIPEPRVSATQINGNVVHIDRFGNIITNITAAELPSEASRTARITIGKHQVNKIGTHFAEADQAEPFGYIGSAGFLEIAVARQNAARLIEARRGMEVLVSLA